MADIFVISSESEMNKASSLANRASRAYYKLKDRNTSTKDIRVILE